MSPKDSDMEEFRLTRDHVNVAPNGPTEDDEETVLEALYGPADENGVYGEGDVDGDE
jgi:hypothetical protein